MRPAKRFNLEEERTKILGLATKKLRIAKFAAVTGH
jgi:hypothetical protein